MSFLLKRQKTESWKTDRISLKYMFRQSGSMRRPLQINGLVPVALAGAFTTTHYVPFENGIAQGMAQQLVVQQSAVEAKCRMCVGASASQPQHITINVGLFGNKRFLFVEMHSLCCCNFNPVFLFRCICSLIQVQCFTEALQNILLTYKMK